ncbi:MAG TPA: segregation/condensation protein A [Dongiaceae bacterium]|nr:segregation/condensation protein A [Dongiaceae bacterium]
MDDQDEIGSTPADPVSAAPEAGEGGPAEPAQTGPAQVEPGEIEPGEIEPGEVEPGQAVAEDSDAEAAAESGPAADEAATEPTERTAEAEPAEAKPADAAAGFDEPVKKSPDDNGDLVLDLDGYEGPIDVLLTLARDQKVDLKKISILELADQYLAFVARARRLRLELAADYLVMAAWLAYLKSRLLLPEPPKDGEPSGAEMAAALAFQLQRLAAMQKAGQALLALPQLNRDFFRRGEPEPVRLIQVPVYNLTLYELLKAYGTHPGRKREGILHIEPLRLFSMDDALHRIGDLIGQKLDWTILRDFLPEDLLLNPLQRRAALAATFAASLELARSGRVQLRQDGTFGPIYLKPGIPRDWDKLEDTDGSDDGGDDSGGGGPGSSGPDMSGSGDNGPNGNLPGQDTAAADVFDDEADRGTDGGAADSDSEQSQDFNQGNHA